jgi:pimeloyl-ACP methyl ester carboxylesterase
MSFSSRLRAVWLWIRSHRGRTIAFAFLMAFALLNIWTYRHAWVMTHFSSGGEPTLPPEKMSWLGRAKVVLTGVNLPRPVNERTPADLELRFETHRIQVSDGTELEAWHIPHPEPRAVVILFHGYESCKAKLLDEMRSFHDLGCASLLVDFRGSGGSTGNVTTLGVYEADDVATTCKLARSLEPGRLVVLFGRSMGSVAILRAIAREGVKPAAIIIECPFDRLLGTVEHRFAAMGLPSFPCAQLLVFWGGVQHGMNGFAHNPVEYAARVDCPALLLHGEADARVSVAEAQSLCSALTGEQQLEFLDRNCPRPAR